MERKSRGKSMRKFKKLSLEKTKGPTSKISDNSNCNHIFNGFVFVAVVSSCCFKNVVPKMERKA